MKTQKRKQTPADADMDQREHMTTEALAKAIGGKSTSIRVRLCQSGSYFGIKPVKLPNGRLLWPADSVERLINQEATKKRRVA